MVAPDTRMLLTSALRPPPGMCFDTAVATTFSLDPTLALLLPVLLSSGDGRAKDDDDGAGLLRLQRLRSHAAAITVFVQQGGISVPRAIRPSPVYSMLESMIVETTSPCPRGGVFHPKVVLVRYRDSSESFCQLRLLVMTRNLTFDRSWDVAVVLDGGIDPSTRTTKNDVLARFIGRLADEPSLAPDRRRQILSLRADLSHVKWELPDGYRQVEFHDPFKEGISWEPPKLERVKRWGIVSPFLSKEALEELSQGIAKPPAFVLSRDDQLAAAGGAPNARVLRDVEDLSDGDDAVAIGVTGLHAKCYMYDYDYLGLDYTRLVIGSANATTAALLPGGRENVEFMVSLSGKRSGNGVKDFEESMEPFWMPWTPGAPDEVDERRDKAREALKTLKQSILDANLHGECRPGDDGRQVLTLRTSFGRNLRLDEGAKSIRVHPITLPTSSAFELALPGNKWELPPVTTLSTTGLLAFELQSEIEDVRESFVLNLPIAGLPRERDDLILANALANAGAFERFLSLLLADSGVNWGGAFAGTPAAAFFPRGMRNGDVPFAEALVRAYCRTPSILKEIAGAVRAADRTSASIIPPEFRELWKGFAPLAEERQ